jgi:hypothetical protein
MNTILCIMMLTSYSFIPAESATLGVVDKSRFSNAAYDNALTRDQFLLVFRRANLSPRSSRTMSVAPWLTTPDPALFPQEQSAFMIDLNQASFALRNCTERSLIVLDEFGKGTLSTGS